MVVCVFNIFISDCHSTYRCPHKHVSYAVNNVQSVGFEKNHGIDLCIYVLKEVIDRQSSLNGSMFTYF